MRTVGCLWSHLAQAGDCPTSQSRESFSMTVWDFGMLRHQSRNLKPPKLLSQLSFKKNTSSSYTLRNNSSNASPSCHGEFRESLPSTKCELDPSAIIATGSNIQGDPAGLHLPQQRAGSQELVLNPFKSTGDCVSDESRDRATPCLTGYGTR